MAFAGAVTNIVNEWRHALGFSAADGLRELAVTLKKIDISAAQCALGFRVAMTMNRLGVKRITLNHLCLMSTIAARMWG
jgi:hypothetical protein